MTVFVLLWSITRRTLRDFYFKPVDFITSDIDVKLKYEDTRIGIHLVTCNPGRITYCLLKCIQRETFYLVFFC